MTAAFSSHDRTPLSSPLKRRPLIWLARELWTRKLDLSSALGCLAFSGALYLLMPAWGARLVNDVLPAGDIVALGSHMLIGLAIFSAATLATFGRIYLMTRLSFRITADMRQRMFERTLDTAPRNLAGLASGDLMSRVSNDLLVFQEAIRAIVASLLPSAILCIGFAASMAWYSPLLFAGLIIIISPLVFVTSYFGRAIHADAHGGASTLSVLLGCFEDTLAGARDIKALGCEEPARTRFAILNAKALKGLLRAEWLTGLHPIAVALATAAGISFTIFLSAWLIQQGHVTRDILVSFLVAAALIYSPLQEASHSIGRFVQFVTMLERFASLENLPPEAGGDTRIAPGSIHGHIRFDNVGFAYKSGAPVLSGLTADIPPGTSVAIIGPSGSGKSTFLDLVAGFAVPGEGRILIDGMDLASLRLGDWRRQIGYVFQEPVLFEGSVLDNIAVGEPGASSEAILAAAHAAHVDEFASRLPRGYDERLSARGSNLSVGQRQRIAIARVLLRNPRVLLFDEPTSALDTESERLVRETIEAVASGRTMLIVTHRLSTIQKVDRIIVIAGGRIVEDGPRLTLMHGDGYYARWLREQQDGTA